MVRAEEGGNDDDPQDHGGRTSRGITQREYSAWRRLHGLPSRDVWSADESEIMQIYHGGYWAPYCDQVPAGTDLELFDVNVISGPGRGAKTLQQALGNVVVDGRIGPATLEATRNADPLKLITRFSAVRRAFYQHLGQPRFLRGWLNRVNFCQTAALKDYQASLVPGAALAEYEEPIAPPVGIADLDEPPVAKTWMWEDDRPPFHWEGNLE
jgi:lysozyme family protein